MFHSMKQKLAAAAMLTSAAMVASPAFASAGSGGLASAATQALSGASVSVEGILIVLIGIVFMFTLYSLIKRAGNK